MGDPANPLYSPLKPGEFRLLKLHSRGNHGGLEGTLEVFSLCSADTRVEASTAERAPDPGPYNALSYTWGAREPQCHIKLNHADSQSIVGIYPNLHKALFQMQELPTPRYLWVDAICINQNDSEEKSSQVREMERIYNQAQGVNIWLGAEGEGSTRAINFIKNQLLARDFDKLVGDTNLAAEWAALSCLMRRPWFSRRWIVQEIALSRSATLSCGSESISWGDFSDAISLFVRGQVRIQTVFRTSSEFKNNPDYLGDLSETPAAQLVDLADSIFSKSEDGNIQAKLLSLEELLCSLYAFEATNPLDTVYAILSIASDVIPSFTPSGQTHPDSVDADPLFLTSRPSTPRHNETSPMSLLQHESYRRSASIESRTGNGHVPPTRKRANSDLLSPLEPNTRRRTNGTSDFLSSSTMFPPNTTAPSMFTTNPSASNTPGIIQIMPLITTSSPDSEYTADPDPRTGPRDSGETNHEVVTTQPPVIIVPQSFLGPTTPARRWSSVSDISRPDSVLVNATQRYRTARFPVNYGKTVYDVCRDVLEFTLKTSNSLDMICRPWAPLSPDLPTWIPPISGTAFGLTGKGTYVRVNADPLSGKAEPGSTLYCAAKYVPARYNFGGGGDGVKPWLNVTGFVIGTVMKRTSPANSGIIPKEWNELVGWADASTRPPDVFWRTLVGDRDSSGQRAKTLWRRACRIAFGLRPQRGDLNPKELIHDEPETYVKEYLDRVIRTVWSRRLAVLAEISSTKSLCLVPEGAEEGDKVCILYGCSVPVLLREYRNDVPVNNRPCWNCRQPLITNGQTQEASYKVIGECYVHGMMDGGALLYRREQRIVDKQFRLI